MISISGSNNAKKDFKLTEVTQEGKSIDTYRELTHIKSRTKWVVIETI